MPTRTRTASIPRTPASIRSPSASNSSSSARARRYTPFQAARTAGVSMDLASRFWRAMGFADIGQAKALTEADVLALRRLAGLVEAGLLSESMAVQVARSTGQTTARLADWQIDSFLEGLTEPPEPGMTRAEVTYPLVELLLPELEEFLIYVWRRQVAAATSRVVQSRRRGGRRPPPRRRLRRPRRASPGSPGAWRRRNSASWSRRSRRPLPTRSRRTGGG